MSYQWSTVFSDRWYCKAVCSRCYCKQILQSMRTVKHYQGDDLDCVPSDLLLRRTGVDGLDAKPKCLARALRLRLPCEGTPLPLPMYCRMAVYALPCGNQRNIKCLTIDKQSGLCFLTALAVNLVALGSMNPMPVHAATQDSACINLSMQMVTVCTLIGHDLHTYAIHFTTWLLAWVSMQWAIFSNALLKILQDAYTF